MQCILVKSDEFENSYPPLYILLKSCLCCCLLATFAAQQLDLEAAGGAQVRSRARWVEDGETSSAYFFRLEKCGADRWTSAIKLDDGTIVSSPTNLRAALADFYTSLFSAIRTDPVIHDSLLCNVSSSLSLGMAALCERAPVV